MKTTKKDLENVIENLKTYNLMPKKIELIRSDGRLGNLVALGYYSENALYIKSEYMNFNEMNQFLNGYYMGCKNSLS